MRIDMRIKIVCELVRKEGETVGCMYSEEIGRQSEMMIGIHLHLPICSRLL